jgi:hypothetical protein
MRLLLYILALVLIVPAMAETKTEPFQLGSHQVSFNLSVPANYEILPPVLDSILQSYDLNITLPGSNGYAKIYVEEKSRPSRDDIKDLAQWAIENANQMGLGGTQYQLTKYQGRDAFELSTPEQRIRISLGNYIYMPEIHVMTVLWDAYTGITISTEGLNASIFEELKNSLNVTSAPHTLQVP